jgi:transcriptional regulator with XRE-family HTH domain
MIEKAKLYQKLGKRLSEVRTKKSITQEDLAFKSGLNRAYIGYIERGERKPTVYTLAKIAKALRIDLYELFKI